MVWTPLSWSDGGGGKEWAAPWRRACWGLCVGICPVQEAEPRWPTWPGRPHCFKPARAGSVPGSVRGPSVVISLK